MGDHTKYVILELTNKFLVLWDVVGGSRQGSTQIKRYVTCTINTEQTNIIIIIIITGQHT
jgi:hypothetical protein